MIGIDTNLLLRLLLDDDPGQNPRIDALFEQYARTPESVLIIDVVLAETIWTLRTVYAQPKPAQVAAIRGLLSQPAFAFEQRSVVEQALATFEQGNAGFADCLIAARISAAGCKFTATFDRRMRRLPGVKVI